MADEPDKSPTIPAPAMPVLSPERRLALRFAHTLRHIAAEIESGTRQLSSIDGDPERASELLIKLR